MNPKLRLIVAGVAIFSGPALAVGRNAPVLQVPAEVAVSLPVSAALFPAGPGAQEANAACLMCHSVEMVLLQPPLTRGEWSAEIEKMRKVYGAPLPAEQIPALATYLTSINGRPN